MTGTDQVKDCYLVALRLLAGQDYTSLALQRKLQLRGFLSDNAQVVIERLTREGCLHDRRYAERFIGAARENGRFTGYRLRQELQRRGVPSELADDLLRESPDEANELEHACNLVSRRYGGFDPNVADERERRRVAGFLQRRGYRMSIIRCVLDGTRRSGMAS